LGVSRINIMEERRSADTEILSRLSVVENKLEDNIEVLTKLVEKHDVMLIGRDGNNGLKTTVSKLVDISKTAKWIVGSLFIIVAGQVIASIIK